MAAQDEPIEPGSTVQQRLQARLDGAPRVIAVQGPASSAGRIQRLTQSHLPLLDALQRRWGASSAWPGRSELPLVSPLREPSGENAGQEPTGAPTAYPAEASAPSAAGLQPATTDRSIARAAGAIPPASATSPQPASTPGGRPTGLVQTREEVGAPPPTSAPVATGARPSIERTPEPGSAGPAPGEAQLLTATSPAPEAKRELRRAMSLSAADAAIEPTDLPLVHAFSAPPGSAADVGAPGVPATVEPVHGQSGAAPTSSVPGGRLQTRSEDTPAQVSTGPEGATALPLSHAGQGPQGKGEAEGALLPPAAAGATPPSAVPAAPAADLPVVRPGGTSHAHPPAAPAPREEGAGPPVQKASLSSGSTSGPTADASGAPGGAGDAPRAWPLPAERALALPLTLPSGQTHPAPAPPTVQTTPDTATAAGADQTPAVSRQASGDAARPGADQGLETPQAVSVAPQAAPATGPAAPVTVQAAPLTVQATSPAPGASGSSTPLVRPTRAPVAPRAASARPEPGSPAVQAEAPVIPVPVVQARPSSPSQPGASGEPPVQRQEAGESGGPAPSLGAPDIHGARETPAAAELPVARTQPAAAETPRRGADPARQDAAAPVQLMRSAARPFSRSATALTPPAPGVVRVWGAPIMQRPASTGQPAASTGQRPAPAIQRSPRRPSEALPAASVRGAEEEPPVGPAAHPAAPPGPSAPSAGRVSAARSASTLPGAAGAPPVDTLAGSPAGEPAALEPLPVARPRGRALPGARPAPAAIEAADAIPGPGLPGVRLQSVAARPVASAPPAGELRLARPPVTPHLLAPPATASSPGGAVTSAAPSLTGEVTRAAPATVIARVPGAASGAGGAPGLQLAPRETAAPSASTSSAGQGMTAAPAPPPQETITRPSQGRLDETEMARVVDAVLNTLKQRLQIERESRGL